MESGIALIEDVCKKEGYIGLIDLNAIINEEGLFGLEWTPRFGYDSLPTILQLIEGDVGQLISDLCKDQCNEMKLSEGIAGGIRLTIPPYPLEPPSAREVQKTSPNRGIPIRGLPSKYKDNYYFFEVMPDEDGNFVHSSGTGVILVASSLGDDAKSSLDLPYKILDDVKIPDKQYRTDLREILPKMYDEVLECEGVESNA